jgi:hypothetical protein
LKGNDYSDLKGEQLPRNDKDQMGSAVLKRGGLKKVLEESRVEKSTKSRLRSTDGD